ncbi:hypothetical protein [uncultured Pontibacter sp.]|uniref:hypothetical protein n=1 Tax=uncultured Pontibacter sp. TaxID=453356 RepID=UPI002616F32C|nr:hypothetical protein [uncultured Pontibacter sp.]
MRSIYFRNAFVSISYDDELRVGMAVWQGNVKGAEFRGAVLLCLHLMDQFRLTGWLADDRKMKAIDPADAQWSNEFFLPRVLSSPIVRLARLPSDCPENCQTIELMKEKRKGYTSLLTIRDFAIEEEAMAWLAVPDQD